MKKIQLYTLLCLTILFGSCYNGEDYDNQVTENVVEGTWINYFENTDKIVMIRVFTPDYYSYFIYADGKDQNELNKGRYHLDAENIHLPSYTQAYKLINDTLWITNSQKDQTTKYIRQKSVN